MEKKLITMAAAILFALNLKAASTDEALSSLLTRIGGTGAADLIELAVDETLAQDDGSETFLITQQDGKPCIKGSTLSATTAGLNWYLNHYAHVNLTWSSLTTDLTTASLPVPSTDETHTSTAECRYYLNYCTFSYSMAFWTWERWEQEIDWMALHGVNMPLALVGADVVWQGVLKELGYTDDEIGDFIAGPGFQAWWLMNNLMGWGGANPSWWYTRQEELCKKILQRMRELGMEPILPGYSGMVPSNVSTKLGWTISDPGTWCGFSRPGFLDPSSEAFTTMSKLYYEKLTDLMGTSKYYSMDPFHEGGNTSGVDLNAAYTAIETAMNTCNPDAQWVIQSWNENPTSQCLNTVEKGKLLILDLFSDGQPKWSGGYSGHDFLYCMLHNFGGRVGMHGRLKTTIEGYYDALSQYPSQLKGIGATPEGIETNPILYDALFELPWRETCDADQWRDEYVAGRYGSSPQAALDAWELIGNSALNCQTSQQGTSEPVICARPSLTVSSVSSWSTSTIYYDREDIIRAAALLLSLKDQLNGENYSYDLCDAVRQAITDRANSLLKQVNAAYTSGDTEKYEALRDMFLQLILDQDSLLATCKPYTLGRWTQMARAVTDEASGTSTDDKDWMEWNARTLITVWGPVEAANSGGLHDYSNREWAGLLKDFHYERWKRFFEALDEGKTLSDWFDWEYAWTVDYSTQYPAETEGETVAVAASLFPKYFTTFGTEADGLHYISYAEEQDFTDTYITKAIRGETFTCPIETEQEAAFSVDFNNDGSFSEGETVSSLTISIPSDAVATRVAAQVELADGTIVKFTLILADEVTEARTVSVLSEDTSQGTASIGGKSSVTTADDVEIEATPADGYDFLYWTDAEGNTVGTSNPFYYYGKEAQTFTAHFVVDKWTAPETDDSELSTIESYGQYVSELRASQVDVDPYVFYTASACPSQLYNIVPQIISAARGSSLTISWTDPNASGLSYCLLSAYIDTNADGDFDDEGELIAVIGTPNQQDYSVCSGSIQILLPSDMPVGITHIRMRFDGAWTGGWDSTTGAKPASATTVRMVYEIRLNVLEHPAQACTITALSEDEAKGTATISGAGATATVQPGESITLQAQPASGYVFKCWTDQWGREVSTEANYQLVPAESGTFTASFSLDLPEYLTLNAWTLSYTASGDGELTLVAPVEGSGSLVIPEVYTYDGKDYPIVALAPSFMKGNEGLESVVIGAAVRSLGTEGATQTETYSWTGDGTQNKLIELSNTLPSDGDWTLSAEISTDGSTFNQWGSGLIASGTDALADAYPSGFQLYLAASGSVVLKCGSTEVKTFSLTQGCSSFTALLSHEADGSWTLTITTPSGSDSYSTSSYALADITQLSSSIPSGVDVQSLTLSSVTSDEQPLFSGCKSLASLEVSEGNQSFASSSSLLYTADLATLLRVPEGLRSRCLSLPSACTAIAPYALSGVALAERLVASEGLEQVDETAFQGSSTLLQVTPSQCNGHGTEWSAPLLVSVSKGETADASLLAQASAIELLSDGSKTGSLTANLTGKQRWLTLSPSDDAPVALYFPTDVDSVEYTSSQAGVTVNDAPQSFLLAQYSGSEFQLASVAEGKAIPAGAYLLWPAKELKSEALTFKMGSTDASLPSSDFTGNGTLTSLTQGSGCFLYNSAENIFLPLEQETAVAPFTAYFLSSATPLPDSYPGLSDYLLGVEGAEGSPAFAVYVIDRRIKVVGADSYRLHNTAGALLPNGSQLAPGVYVVSSEQGQRKVLVP
ncbi:MAG: alpha-N-acetylglucosaminidase C-terminal domain-containing protein [Prevotellaceae bacterium]|nr:alpha-N-acetylglucosaminidase C-terminal domain-containing protein [Prevotellaceae bacterium]